MSHGGKGSAPRKDQQAQGHQPAVERLLPRERGADRGQDLAVRSSRHTVDFLHGAQSAQSQHAQQ